jgi:hypothetical protein
MGINVSGSAELASAGSEFAGEDIAVLTLVELVAGAGFVPRQAGIPAGWPEFQE